MKRPVNASLALIFCSCVLSWLAGPYSARADWPTYRYDSRRSGASAEELKLPLQEAWNHKAAQAPRPAWPELPAVQDVWHRVHPLGPTTTFDRALHVAVSAGRLYYGSSADDSVYCLDAASGSQLWSFTTEGPVRLAPVVAGGKVYAGSDDGCVYCLAAADGRLLWRHRGGPEDRRLPGNERMISLWPIRCGIVVEGGTVYFCAGLFPTQGSYLCAVRADDGVELWKRPIEISPQGYLLASASRLFVPTGRTAPYAFERADGQVVGQFPGTGPNRRAGGCFAVLLDDTTVYSGGELGGVHFAAPGAKEKLVFADGQRLVASGPTSYILSKDRLYALDRAAYLELTGLRAKKQKTGADQERIRELASKGYVKWEIPCPDAYELILAGSTIVVGGTDRVAAYRTQDGGAAWNGAVAGKAYGLAVSDGDLFASTDKGNVHCFRQAAGGKPSQPAIVAAHAMAPQSPYPDDDLTARYGQAAEAALAAVDARKGYCLVLGAGQGRLAYEIARRSQFQVIGVEPDAARASAARKLLRQTGLYGTRISIHQAALDKLPYAKFCINLVVCEETLRSGKLPPSAAEVHRVLRPYGGTVALMMPPGADNAANLARWGSAAMPGWSVAAVPGGLLGKALRGPLPGAGEWSHLYADAGNTACSNDATPHGPMDIQWFGRPGPRRMPDRHDKNMAPLYKNGRVFVTGDNYLAAVDAYNGTVLWDRDMPASVRLGAFKHCGSMAAGDDCLYVASGSDCVALDAQTGRHRLTLSVPPGADGGDREWGYVAVADDLLFGSVCRQGASFREQTIDTEVLIWRDFMPVVCSDSLFARERRSGKPRWSYQPGQGVIVNPTIAIGGGRVYFVESANPQTRLVSDSRIKLDMLLGRANLVALDASTGKTLWQRPASLEQLQHIVYLSYAKEKLVVTGTKNVRVDGKERVRYDLCAFDAATGSPLWKTTQTPVPDHILQGPHGEQVQHSAIVGDAIYNTGFTVNLQTGEPVDGWKWQKSGTCGILSTSAACGFSRYDTPRMFDLKTGQFTALTKVTRPGCWINVLPAGGMILIPEASAGCTCGYSIQTSIALTPRDG